MNVRPALLTMMICAVLYPLSFGVAEVRSQATDPPYLAEFPTVQRVRAELRGSDSMDTAARQMGAFWQFGQVIRKLASARYNRRATPGENQLISQYGMAYGAIQQYYASYPDRQKWSQAHAFYQADEAFLDQLLQQFFSTEFRAGYYRSIGKQLPQAQRSQPSESGGTSSTGQPSVPIWPSRAEVNRDRGHKEFEAGQKFDVDRNEAAAAQAFTRALGYYKAAIALDSQITGVYYPLGSCYYKAKEYQLALSMWKKFRAQDPNNIRVLSDMSRAYCALKQYDQALPLVLEGIQRKPDKIDSLLLYGELCDIQYGLKEYEKALAACQQVNRIEPFFTNHRMMGDTYYQLQRYPEAVESYKRATSGFNKSAAAYYGLGLTYVRMGQRDLALGVYKELLGMDQRRAQELLTEINKSSAAQPTERPAQQPAGPVWGPRPTSPDAKSYYEQGKKFYLAKEFAKSVEPFRRAVELDPNLSDAQYFLGLAYNVTGQRDKALAPAKEAVRLKPDQYMYHFGLGLIYFNLKQYENAFISFRQSNQLNADFAENYYWLGLALKEGSKQYDKAISAFLEFLRRKPDYANGYRELGAVYYLLKQYPQALKATQEALRLSPNDSGALLNLGQILLSMGRKDEALQVHKNLITLDRRRADALYAEINKSQ